MLFFSKTKDKEKNRKVLYKIEEHIVKILLIYKRGGPKNIDEELEIIERLGEIFLLRRDFTFYDV